MWELLFSTYVTINEVVCSRFFKVTDVTIVLYLRFALDLWNCHTWYEWLWHICKQIKQPRGIIMNPKTPCMKASIAMPMLLLRVLCKQLALGLQYYSPRSRISHTETLISLDIWTANFCNAESLFTVINHWLQCLISILSLSSVLSQGFLEDLSFFFYLFL